MIQTIHLRLRRSLLLALIAMLGACGLSQPYPAKQLYAIDVQPPARLASSPDRPVLRVRPVRMTDPFGQEMFHYRVSSARFEPDYYANFVDEPGRLITAELIEWLAKTGEYQAVVDASSTVETDRSLQLVINELYGDVSDPRSPRAVVAARFFLLDEREVETKVLFTRDYREAEIVGGEGGDALVEAWGTALARIFEQMATDLRAVQ